MIKRIVSFLAAVALLAAPAVAENRVQWPANIQPPSQWMNIDQKNQEIALGQMIYDFFGRSSTPILSNTAVVPNTGMFVAMEPAATNTVATLYQVGPADTSSFGTGVGLLAPDPTLIFHQGMLLSMGNSVGPLVAPTTAGFTVKDVIECQVQTTDQTSQTVNFVSSTNVASTGTVDRDRADDIYCQAKLGTAGTSPTVPSVDSGWISAAVVTIPYATTTITTGMIVQASQFGGFAQSGTSFVDTTTNGQAITATKTWNGMQTYTAGQEFTGSGVATGFGSIPGISADGQTSLGLLINVGASAGNGVQFLNAGTLNGAVITPAGAFKTGSNALASTGLTVGGDILTDTGTGVSLTYPVSTTATTVLKSDATNTYLNSVAASGGAVEFGSSASATAFGKVNASGYTVGSSVYGPTSATINGTLNVTGLTTGNCLQLDGSHNVVSASGPCGVTSGSVTGFTAGSNITGSIASGNLTVGVVASPVFGTATVGSAASVGSLAMGTDGNYTIDRSAAAFKITPHSSSPNPSLEVDNGFIAGSSTYGASAMTLEGNGLVNYSTSSAGYLRTYDGGTANYSNLTNTALTFSANATSYGSTLASVIGGVTASGALTGGSLSISGTSSQTGNATFGGTLGVTGATTLAALGATNGTFSGTLGVTGTTTLAGLGATNGTFSGTLGVTGTTTLAGLGATNGTFSGTLGVTGTSTLGVVNATGAVSSVGNTNPPANGFGIMATGSDANGYIETNTSTAGGTVYVRNVGSGGVPTLNVSGPILSGSSVTAGGVVKTNANIGNAIPASFTGGSGYVGIGENGTNGGSDLTLVNSNSTADLATFYEWNGSAYTQRALVGSDGTWNTGSSAYGPTSTTVNGTIAANGNIQSQGTVIGGGTGSGNLAVEMSYAGVQGLNSGSTASTLGLNPTGAAVTVNSGVTGGGLSLSGANDTWNITLPNSACPSGVSEMGTSQAVNVAGITASSLLIGYCLSGSSYLVAVDGIGNEGIAGNYYAASQRKLKTAITKLPFDPLNVVDKADVLSWCYQHESLCLSGKHSKNVGIMADDAPLELLDGPDRKAVNVNNEVSVALAAIKELHGEVTSLKAEVATLKGGPAVHQEGLLEKIHDAIFGN